MNSDRWLASRATVASWPVWVTSGLGIADGLLLIVGAGLVVRIAEEVIFAGAGLADVAVPLALLPVVLAARAAALFFMERTAFESAAAIKRTVRGDIAGHLVRLGPIRLQTERAGDLVNTTVDAVEALEAYCARYLPQRAVAAAVPLAILLFVYPLDLLSGAIMTGTAIMIPVLMVVIGSATERLNRRQWGRLANLSARFLDSFRGLETIRIFSASRRELAIIEQLSQDYRHSSMAVMRSAFLSALMLELFSAVSIALIAVSLGLRLMEGDADFHAGYFILLLAPEFYKPLRALGTHYHARTNATAAAARIRDILGVPAHPTAEPEQPQTAGQSIEFPLEFHDVRFGYERDRSVLDGINLSLAAGERVAIVGRSGAGKSTILALLLRFASPWSGRITSAGTPIDLFAPHDWYRNVAWVPQRPHLFHGTIADNIRMGSREATIREVRDAAERSHADRFISALPDGYETVVGERGVGLSGGQAQQIAIARAFMKEAPLVLLDEPAAHLDSVTERQVSQSIDELVRGRSALIVAHRLHTVEAADRIVVVEHGRVAEEGVHRELITSGGVYARMLHLYTTGHEGERA